MRTALTRFAVPNSSLASIAGTLSSNTSIGDEASSMLLRAVAHAPTGELE